MQRYTISRNSFYDESMTLFLLSKTYSKSKIGVTPLVEVSSTVMQDRFEDNNDYSKYISVFDIEKEGVVKISADDLLELYDLYFSKDRNDRNADDIDALSLHQFDDIKRKLQEEELIIFSVSAFYQEIKIDEDNNNAQYKEYQSFYSELEDKVNFTMTDDFYFEGKEYTSRTLFIFADYNQTEFIILPYQKNKCLVKLPVSDATKAKIGRTATVNAKTFLKFDNIEVSDDFSEDVTILANFNETYTVEKDGETKDYTHNWVVFLMDCMRDVKIGSIGISFMKNPYYTIPFGDEGPQLSLIPYLYVNVNPSYHRFFPSFTALGMDYAETSFPLYARFEKTDEDGVINTALIDIMTVFGAETQWDYLSDRTIRLPLTDFQSYLGEKPEYLTIKSLLQSLFSSEELEECSEMCDLIKERQEAEAVIFETEGKSEDLYGITDKFSVRYSHQPSFYRTDTVFAKDIVDNSGIPFVFKDFDDGPNTLPNEIGYNGVFKLLIAESPLQISIPFGQTFDIDTYQDEIVSENYLSDMVDSQVNGIVDMERDVYYPVWFKNGVFKDVKEIRYTFHFKERDSDYHLVDSTNLWSDNFQQFSSDFLGYIGFTNKDVYYQKNALKMSFMRSTYYNTPSTGNQEALCYNTSFVDYRRLYQLLAMDNSLTVFGSSDNSKRLDTSIIVKDKHASENSSEGFYIYIWKGDEKIELYNAIDFNNAKFGITSPMMLANVVNFKPQFPKDYQKLLQARHIKWIAEYNQDLKKHIYYIDPEWLTEYGWEGIRFEHNNEQGLLEISLWEIHLNQK